jgi:hypothetical protein
MQGWPKHLLKPGYSLRGKRSIEKGTSALPARGNRIKSYHEINRTTIFFKLRLCSLLSLKLFYGSHR